MELRQVRYFLVLAEELHFRRAADKLFIVQPALSKQIKNLEEEIGAELFDRSRRKVSLTRAGEYYKTEMEQLLRQLEQVNNRVRLVSEGQIGEIRIGYVGSCIHTFLPEIIGRLHEQSPKIHLYLDEMTTSAQLRALQRGRLDLAFCRNPELPSQFARKLVFRETFSVVVPSDHPLRAADFKEIKQLAEEGFILPKRSDGNNYFQLQMSICEDAGFRPEIVHETVHGYTALALVDQHFGVSILPTSFREVSSANVRFFELGDIPQRSEITAVWDRENPNPALHRLVEMIRSS